MNYYRQKYNGSTTVQCHKVIVCLFVEFDLLCTVNPKIVKNLIIYSFVFYTEIVKVFNSPSRFLHFKLAFVQSLPLSSNNHFVFNTVLITSSSFHLSPLDIRLLIPTSKFQSFLKKSDSISSPPKTSVTMNVGNIFLLLAVYFIILVVSLPISQAVPVTGPTMMLRTASLIGPTMPAGPILPTSEITKAIFSFDRDRQAVSQYLSSSPNPSPTRTTFIGPKILGGPSVPSFEGDISSGPFPSATPSIDEDKLSPIHSQSIDNGKSPVGENDEAGETPMPLQTDLQSSPDSGEADVDEDDSNDNDEDVSTLDDGSCIGAHHLVDLDSIMVDEGLVYASHRRAAALCDSVGSCATAGHIVTFNETPMMMKSYCSMVTCTRRVMLVNSPRFNIGTRTVIKSHTHGLMFTPFAARYQSRLEERALGWLVRIGL